MAAKNAERTQPRQLAEHIVGHVIVRHQSTESRHRTAEWYASLSREVADLLTRAQQQ